MELFPVKMTPPPKKMLWVGTPLAPRRRRPPHNEPLQLRRVRDFRPKMITNLAHI